MLLVAPGIGWWAARMTYRYGMGATAWEQQHRFPVDAVLLGDGSGWPVDRADGLPPVAPALTPARWKDPDGVAHTAMIFAGEEQRSGTTVRIWVDDGGAVVPPPGRRNATANATLIGMLAVSGVAAGLCGLRGIVVWRLNRRRLRAWQDDWLLVEPSWSHR
jgi:hypothetical protein